MQADEQSTQSEAGREAGEATAPRRRGQRVVMVRPGSAETPEEFARAFLSALLGEDDPRVQRHIAEAEASEMVAVNDCTLIEAAAEQQ